MTILGIEIIIDVHIVLGVLAVVSFETLLYFLEFLLVGTLFQKFSEVEFKITHLNKESII